MSEDRALSGVARRPEPRLLVYGGLVAALALGAGLRLYLLSDQPLLDDEWHAVAFARKLSFFGSLIRINIGANSPAVNFYAWLVLHTVGYSEWVLRLPFLAAGLLGLVVMPLSVRSVVTGRAAVVFGFLLAISPSLIYYSRLFRAYGAYVVLGFLAITCLYLWAVRGGRKWAGGFVILGSVAVYFTCSPQLRLSCRCRWCGWQSWLVRRVVDCDFSRVSCSGGRVFLEARLLPVCVC